MNGNTKDQQAFIKECKAVREVITKHWPMTVQVPELVDGQVVLVDTTNILDGKFLIQQVYAFPVNEAEGGSVTVHKCTILEGTEVEVGYKAVRDFIQHLGYDPFTICNALHFNEVIGVPF